MKKQLLFGRAVLFITGIGIALIGTQAFYPQITRGKVLSASSLYDLSIVTYKIGQTELIYNDYDYSLNIPDYWDVRTVVDAIPSEDSRYPEFRAPNIVLIGASPQKVIHIFDDPASNECQRNLLYLDRTTMNKEKFTISRTDYCIKNVVDEWDMTTFFAINPENTKIALGNTADGKIVASINVANVSSRPGHNWENTKIAFVTGGINFEGEDTRKLFLWDVNASVLIDRTEALEAIESNIGLIHYVHDTDSFDLYDDRFEVTLGGEGKVGSFK